MSLVLVLILPEVDVVDASIVQAHAPVQQMLACQPHLQLAGTVICFFVRHGAIEVGILFLYLAVAQVIDAFVAGVGVQVSHYGFLLKSLELIPSFFEYVIYNVFAGFGIVGKLKSIIVQSSIILFVELLESVFTFNAFQYAVILRHFSRNGVNCPGI